MLDKDIFLVSQTEFWAPNIFLNVKSNVHLLVLISEPLTLSSFSILSMVLFWLGSSSQLSLPHRPLLYINPHHQPSQ